MSSTLTAVPPDLFLSWSGSGVVCQPVVSLKVKEVKEVLQEIYDDHGMNTKAKATDLPNYIPCTKAHTKAGDIYRID